ncbi:GNAT family N-acetyltransferase [Streptomyces sp. NPDC058657]|uniref:GNAT family N-acetyltransferase n=1 Tax=unclassified Streptomyces TaxID=2593676 RepID=UPI00365141EE
MTTEDIPAVAAVRVLGWQRAYAGLVPQSYLDAMDQQQERTTRTEHFRAAGPQVVNLVAERAAEVVGWACWGPYREAEAVTGDPEAAELYTLYVHPDRLSTGAGRALMARAAAGARAAGFTSLRAWVLRDNARALRFYRKAGFTVDPGEESFELDGATVYEVRCSRRLSEAAAAALSLG